MSVRSSSFSECHTSLIQGCDDNTETFLLPILISGCTVDSFISLTYCLQLNTFFSPSRSMIPVQCAEKALTVSTTASCPHQNPQNLAPSGQSNRRGRQSEKRAKQIYLPLLFSRDTLLTSDLSLSTVCSLFK